MIGYKGFNEKLQCAPDKNNPFQFEIGGEYEESEAELCRKGFHFCENPIDVFKYYPPGSGRYCEIEADDVSDKKSDDSKRCAKKLKIGAEIGINGIVKAFVKFTLDKIDWNNKKETNTGDCSAATNTGDCSAATNTGYYSAATNTGYCSAATNTGYYSAATNTGDCSVATNTGDYSAATNTGNYSAATNTGYYSAATNTGYYSAATNTGYYSAATNTGDCSAATNTGDCSVATVESEKSVACALGYNCKAKAPIGSAIVIAERDIDGNLLKIKAAIIDGKRLKADTFYKLVEGKFVKAEGTDV